MLSQVDKPKRGVSQAPIKFTQCIGECGTSVPYRTSPRVCCAACKVERKRLSARRAATVQRRKRGVLVVKGTAAICVRCKCEFERQGIKAKFCEACRENAARERAKARVNRLCRERGAPKVGTSFWCANCGAEATRTSGRDKYCAPCKELSSAGKLPHLQRARRAYWEDVLKPRYSTDLAFIQKAKESASNSRNRRKKNPAFTINERMSAAIRGSLKSGKQGSSWESLVGYTVEQLVRHLERQFLPRMTWDNRGEWEIDHILPVSSFKFETAAALEFKAAWALANLRPLWREANNEKRAKRLFLI